MLFSYASTFFIGYVLNESIPANPYFESYFSNYQWEWITKESNNFSNWYKDSIEGYPKNKIKKCVTQKVQSLRLWVTESCDTPNHYTCELKANSKFHYLINIYE